MKTFSYTKATSAAIMVTAVLASAGTYANDRVHKASFDKKPVSHQIQPASLLTPAGTGSENKDQRTEKQSLLNKKLPYIAKRA